LQACSQAETDASRETTQFGCLSLSDVRGFLLKLRLTSGRSLE
jgi:hypothetical protein